MRARLHCVTMNSMEAEGGDEHLQLASALHSLATCHRSKAAPAGRWPRLTAHPVWLVRSILQQIKSQMHCPTRLQPNWAPVCLSQPHNDRCEASFQGGAGAAVPAAGRALQPLPRSGSGACCDVLLLCCFISVVAKTLGHACGTYCVLRSSIGSQICCQICRRELLPTRPLGPRCSLPGCLQQVVTVPAHFAKIKLGVMVQAISIAVP